MITTMILSADFLLPPLLPSLLLLLVLLLIGVHLHLTHSEAYRIALQLPGTAMLPIIGNMIDLLTIDSQQAFRYLRECARAHGGRSYRFWILGTLHYNAIRAQDLEAVLSSSRHIRKSLVYDFLHPLMGTGLLTSTGQKWFERRRILTPAFHFNILQDFLAIFGEESAKLVSGLTAAATNDETTVLQEIIPRFTLNTICESAMGVKIDSMAEPDGYRANLIKMGQWLVFRCTQPLLHTNAIYQMSGLPLLLQKYLRPVHAFSADVIRRRRSAFLHQLNDQNSQPDDADTTYTQKRRYAMLDTLLAAEVADRNQIDESGIREEVDTFMFEGFDTTSSALTFCLLMLAHHPAEQQRVLDEITAILADSAEHNSIGDLRVSDFNQMSYLDCFVRETMRLYPPVAFMGRQLTEELLLPDGVRLPAGTQIHIHSFDLHRDPAQFAEPERFDPERFAAEQRTHRHPFAYVAFSAGPRNCIGQRFAMLEIKCLLAHILLAYRVEPVTRVEDVVFVADIVLRSKDPIRVRFRQRAEENNNREGQK